MDYLIICISSILFSLQFLFHKNYNDKYGSSLNASLIFSIYTSILGGIILFIIGYFFVGMEIEFTLFSIMLATVYSIIGISFTIVSAKALDKTNLSIFSMFAMLGGMVIPFVFGVIAKGEPLPTIRIIGIILMIGILVFSSINKKDVANSKNKKKYLYYVSVFTLNGLVGVISSIHQMNKFSNLAVDSYQFAIIGKIITCLLSFVILKTIKQKMIMLPPKTLLLTTCYSAFNSIGNLFIFIALLTLPTSVQYPIITGGTILISSIISCIKEKKIDIKNIICAILSLISTIMFII